MTQPDLIDDLGARLEAAIKTLDDSRRQLAEVLPSMRRVKHPRLNGYLAFAHRAGFTLDELGQMLGCTRERVRQRIAAGDPAPKPPPFVINETSRRKLRALRDAADGRAPRRGEATHAYRAELARLRECGATMAQLAEVLGVTHAAVWQQLRLLPSVTPTHRPAEEKPW